MRERSILALGVGSSSSSQASSVMLNCNDTRTSNVSVYVMVGADYQKQRDLCIFCCCCVFAGDAICTYLQWHKNKRRNIMAERKMQLPYSQTQHAYYMHIFRWSKCMAFLRGTNKAGRLSHPLWQITVTADANKEEECGVCEKKMKTRSRGGELGRREGRDNKRKWRSETQSDR